MGSLADYRAAGGWRAVESARRLDPGMTIETISAAGLRGRGGAGFPTGVKWQTVARNASPRLRATVVVNGAEGEPGTFKDRTLLRRNPYRVLEGALIAAHAVGADTVVMALKASFTTELKRVRAAIAEIEAAGTEPDGDDAVAIVVAEGPDAYLFGEESAMLEVLDGRQPFPRVAPPYRAGIGDVALPRRSASSGSRVGARPVTSASGERPGSAPLSAPGEASDAPPTLVNNVETLANVALIVTEGPDWFRQLGTDDSPGTVLCTVTGRVRRHGVAEFPMGTAIGDVITEIGLGTEAGHSLTAVLSGVSNPVLTGADIDTPVTYEAMHELGTGVGSGGFIVFDDTMDPVAVAHGVARFLAVESCGQCTHCKGDGLAITEALETLRRGRGSAVHVRTAEDRLATVAEGARCYIGIQHEQVVGSILARFPDAVRRRQDADEPVDQILIAPIVVIADDRAILADDYVYKQPDWTYDDEDSGRWPAEVSEVG